MMLSISVVIPLFNHANYIDEAIYSVLTQSRRASEIIVVDDGSNDASFARASRMARDHPQIIVWSHPNRGAHATLNSAIHRATGEIVSVLNSDDAYEPERLERCAAAVESGGADAVFTGLTTIDARSSPCRNEWLDAALSFYKKELDLGRTLINGNIFVSTSNLFARRSLFTEIGGFSDLRYAHDLDFFLRLVSHRKKVHYLDEALLKYRLHESNTISESHARVKLEWAIATAFFLALEGRRLGWGQLSYYMDLLINHDLLRLVAPMIGYLSERPASSLERHPILCDEELKSRLAGLIG